MSAIRAFCGGPVDAIVTIDGEHRASRRGVLAALGASCLIHAALVLVTVWSLGTPSDAGNSAIVSGGMPQGPLTAALRSAPAAVEADDPGSSRATTGDATAAAADVGVAAPQATAPSPRREGAGLLPIDGSAYYAASELTRPPQPLADVALDPPEIQPVIASGRIVMKLWIDADGGVENVVVEESELPAFVARSAVTAFMQARFAPGELAGRKVATVMRIEVTYEDPRSPGSPS